MSFPTTNWTQLAEATLAGDASGGQALEEMCRAYRRPIGIFLASRGYRKEEIEDLVQDFFLKWLKSRAWKRADRNRGRFRTFLLGAVLHSLAHGRTRGNAAKRGGGREPVSLEEMAESGQDLPDESAVSDPAFDREWACTLIANTVTSLEREFGEAGREREFAVLRAFLPGSEAVLTLEAAAERLGSNPNAVKSAVHRLRARFRETLRTAVARTVSAPHEIEEELSYLRSLLLQNGANLSTPDAKNPNRE